MKKFYNIFTIVMVALIGLSITACSDDDLDTNPYSKSGVNLLAFGPAPALRTSEIRITGTNMQNVSKVVFPHDSRVAEAAVDRSAFNKADNENIYVNIPDETVPGPIKLIAGNDTITSVGTLTFEEPIEVTSIEPMTGLNAGDVITVKGDYVYNIASVTFANDVVVPADMFTSTSRFEIVVPVPRAAVSGVVSFSDGADWTLEWDTPLEIISASVSSIDVSNVEFGDVVTIKGNNLHTVENVMFAGGVSADFQLVDNNTIKAVVPAECKSGAITLLLYSGDVISTPEVTVPTVTIASISQAKDLCEGDEVTLTGTNFKRVTKVTIPGAGDVDATVYQIVSDTEMKITIPEGTSDGDIVLTQNSNISASIHVETRKLANVIWQGKENLEGWSNFGVFNWSGASWDTFKEAIQGPGELTFHFVQKKAGAAFNCKMGDWATAFANPSITPEADGVFKPAEGVEDLVISVTAEEAEKMFGSGAQGFVIWGDGIQLQYIKFVAAGAEQNVWEGSEDLGSWSSQPFIGSDTAPELAALNAAEGNVVRFYLEPTADDWQFQVFEGHWGPKYGAWAGKTVYKEDGSVDNDYTIIEGNVIAITLTKAMLDAAYTQQWWGGIWVVQGQHCIVKKVTLAPL